MLPDSVLHMLQALQEALVPDIRAGVSGYFRDIHHNIFVVYAIILTKTLCKNHSGNSRSFRISEESAQYANLRKFSFLRKSGCRRLLCIGSRPLNGNIYWMSPLSFSRISISVPLTFFRTTLSISFSLKDSGASLMGFLSMA